MVLSTIRRRGLPPQAAERAGPHPAVFWPLPIPPKSGLWEMQYGEP